MKTAIVSGASSGMGREFVRQLDAAEEFDEIWVIARRRERLEELVGTTRAKIRPVPLDLSLPDSMKTYADLLAEANPDVRVLVCASGYGKFGAVMEMPLAEQTGMIDLNVKALTEMTYLTVPYMSQGSCIYELGSLSSFQPVPYIGVYGATKAYVLSFSRALNVELAGRGIRVMAVCPGWVKTEFFDRAVHDDTITYYNRYYTSEQVVTRALRDMKKGKDVSVCGAPVRFQVFLTKHLPHRLVMRIWCRQQKK